MIRSARLVDSRHPLNGKMVDIHIRKGVIQKISKTITPASCGADVKVISKDGLHVSIGWFDMAARFCDPGFEYKEDLITGAAAAAAGGFTGVLVMPDTFPVVQTKADVEYILNKSKNLPVEVHVAGALTQSLDGKDLAELYDMKQAGAVAFTNSKKPVTDAGQMLRSLIYARNCDSIILSHPNDYSLSGKLLMNESVNSVLYGMKGSPSIAEEVMLQRDLMLNAYSQSRIHFLTLSASGSVALIKEAKKKSEGVSAGIAAHQLWFTDESVGSYDSNFKVNPPFRTEVDKLDLIKGLKNDVIDVICSDHTPQDTESKDVEYESAKHGIIGLETAFACAWTVTRKQLTIEQLIEKISVNPRNILNLEVPAIEEGKKANLTLFRPDEEWKFEEKHIRSKSKNSPFINQVFTGRPVAIITGNDFITSD
ncbi:MAG: dihydroorotase [Bacteroidia bacterium]|nr:dihydroorotase [Bacteroidia bacterium]